YIVSQRNTSSVLVLEPGSFRLRFKFGVTQPSDFVFATPDDAFYAQHDAHELAHKNKRQMRILMFDDGTTRPASQGGPYARGIEYELDLHKRTISKVWEFRPRVDLSCSALGSARRLCNGHTIVDFGAPNLKVKHIVEAGS